jgi:hypothetical protein
MNVVTGFPLDWFHHLIIRGRLRKGGGKDTTGFARIDPRPTTRKISGSFLLPDILQDNFQLGESPREMCIYPTDSLFISNYNHS